MSFEEALKKWAAAKYDLSLVEIDTVTVDGYDRGAGCDTCGYGGGFGLDVNVFSATGSALIRDTIEYDFAGVIKEIVEASFN